jgi:mono/diheme cytochrome c family protein/rhodanese-related sulfurtransferase
MVARRDWHRLDDWAAKDGWQVVLVARFIPVIAFNLINYAAGLTRLTWWQFTWTTGVGILPLTILMVVMGDNVESLGWESWLLLLAGGIVLWLAVRRRLRAHIGMVLIAAVAASVLMGVAQAGEIPPEGPNVETKDDAQLARGARVYGKHCALCHGENGEGYLADNANALGNPDFLVSVSDNFLWRSIANGRPDTPMAAHAKRYGGPLDDADIDALVALIRGWQQEEAADIAPEPIIGDPAVGRSVFTRSCAACHGDQGQGVTAISLNNPEFLAAASDGQIRWAILHGRRGTPMAAFDDQLPEETINDLVALIRSWQRDAPMRAEDPELPEAQNVVLNPNGPPPRFSLREGRYVPAEQLDAAMRNGIRLALLDARPTSDWHLGHIPGAVSAPHYDPESIIERLPRDGTWIVSYCACPHKYSDTLMDALRSAGFQNTAVLDEGVTWWRQEGFPMEDKP